MDTQRLSQTVQPLLDWFQAHARTLPWRADREPYHVWLSEIMLQQTRVEAVRGYYARFLAAAPDVFALAALPEAQLLKLWEGLGYYNRARKAQECARVIAARGGVWPDTVEGLLALLQLLNPLWQLLQLALFLVAKLGRGSGFGCLWRGCLFGRRQARRIIQTSTA